LIEEESVETLPPAIEQVRQLRGVARELLHAKVVDAMNKVERDRKRLRGDSPEHSSSSADVSSSDSNIQLAEEDVPRI